MAQVLDCFTAEQQAWSLADLCVHLRLPKSTLHRFLGGLESQRILRRNAENGKWEMGGRLSIWAGRAKDSDNPLKTKN